MHAAIESPLRIVNRAVLSLFDSIPYGDALFRRLAEPYVAGHSVDEALDAIHSLFQTRGWYSTFDVLGEAAYTVAEADRYFSAYVDSATLAQNRFGSSYPRMLTFSLKPSAICAVDASGKHILPETSLDDRLENIVHAINDLGFGVTLDMEDRHFTTDELDAARYVWKRSAGVVDLGIVLQSGLHRTQEDVRKYLANESYPLPKEMIRVRVCIGIYSEPSEYATRSKKEAKQRLVERVRELFAAGVYVEIATHDPRVVETVVNDVILKQHISSDRFEFQFLKGVYQGEVLAQHLSSQGYIVRLYMPAELSLGEGDAYMKRRLIANPGLVFLAAKNVGQQILGVRTKQLPQGN